MAAKIAQFLAAGFGLFAIVFTITSLATSKWMQACIPYSEIMNAIATPAGGSSSEDLAKALLKDKNLCYDVGLFAVAISFPPILSVNFPFPINALDTFVKATIGLLVVGLLVLLVGTVLIILSAVSASHSSSRKVAAHNYHRFGLALLTLGTFFLFCGTMSYTVPQSSTIHNPEAFYNEINAVVMKSLSQVGSSMSSSSMTPSVSPLDSIDLNPNRRKKRQSASNVGSELHSLNHQQAMASKYMTFDSLRKEVKSIFSLLDPVFGYSFYLAWLSFVFALIASVIAAFGYFMLRRDNPDVHRVPMI